MPYLAGIKYLASWNGIGTTVRVPFKVPVILSGYVEPMGFGEDSVLLPGGGRRFASPKKSRGAFAAVLPSSGFDIELAVVQSTPMTKSEAAKNCIIGKRLQGGVWICIMLTGLVGGMYDPWTSSDRHANTINEGYTLSKCYRAHGKSHAAV